MDLESYSSSYYKNNVYEDINFECLYSQNFPSDFIPMNIPIDDIINKENNFESLLDPKITEMLNQKVFKWTIHDLIDKKFSESIINPNLKHINCINSTEKKVFHIKRNSILFSNQAFNSITKLKDTIGSYSAIKISKSIYIGTKNGYVFNLNNSDVKIIKDDSLYGSVIAIDVNSDDSLLCVGFISNTLILWKNEDNTFKNPIKMRLSIDLSSQILQLTFGAYKHRLFILTKCGSFLVFTIDYGLLNVSYTTRKIIKTTTKYGCISVLPLCSDEMDKMDKKYDIVAFVNGFKIQFFGISDEKIVNLLEYNLVNFVPSNRFIFPILEFVKTFSIYKKNNSIRKRLVLAMTNYYVFIDLSLTNDGSLSIERVKTNELSGITIHNIMPIDMENLFIIDSSSILYLLSQQSGQIIECVSLRDKHISTRIVRNFPNDSENPINITQHDYISSLNCTYRVSYNDKYGFTVLSNSEISFFTCRNWKERFEILYNKKKDYVQCINMLLNYVKNKKNIGGMDFKTTCEKVLKDYYEDRLRVISDMSGSLKIEILNEYFKMIVNTFFMASSYLNINQSMIDILLDGSNRLNLFPVSFFEILIDQILCHKVKKISTHCMKYLIEFIEIEKSYAQLESIILVLDNENSDLNQLVNICWKNQLYDAYFHIYSVYRNNVVIPIKKMLDIFIEKSNLTFQTNPESFKEKLPYETLTIVHKSYYYVSCCLIGDIHNNLLQTAANDVLTLLLDKPNSYGSWSYIKILLYFNAKELINILNFSLNKVYLNASNNALHKIFPKNLLLEFTRTIVEIILSDNECMNMAIDELCTLIINHINCFGNISSIPKSYLLEIANRIMLLENIASSESLINLINFNVFNNIELLSLTDKAQNKNFKIYHVILEKLGDFETLLNSMISFMSTDSEYVFTSIKRIILLVDAQKMINFFTKNLTILLKFNRHGTFKLLIDHYPKDYMKILYSIRTTNPESYYHFAKITFNLYISNINNFDDTASESKYLNDDIIDPCFIEDLIRLGCIHEPDAVIKYLSSNNLYRLDQTLTIVRSEKHELGISFILEKMEQYDESFEVLSKILSKLLNSLKTSWDDVIFDEFTQKLMLCSQFLERISVILINSNYEIMWFKIFDIVCECYSLLPDSIKNSNNMLSCYINTMINFMSAIKILQHVFSKPKMSKNLVDLLSNTVLNMSSTCLFEATMLETTCHTIDDETKKKLDFLHHQSSFGYFRAETKCDLCYVKASDSNTDKISPVESFVLFKCGHFYHKECFNETASLCTICSIKCQFKTTNSEKSITKNNQKILRSDNEISNISFSRSSIFLAYLKSKNQ